MSAGWGSTLPPINAGSNAKILFYNHLLIDCYFMILNFVLFFCQNCIPSTFDHIYNQNAAFPNHCPILHKIVNRFLTSFEMSFTRKCHFALPLWRESLSKLSTNPLSKLIQTVSNSVWQSRHIHMSYRFVRTHQTHFNVAVSSIGRSNLTHQKCLFSINRNT